MDFLTLSRKCGHPVKNNQKPNHTLKFFIS